jgi:TolB-like protein/Tfp pilus assembly protein PilF
MSSIWTELKRRNVIRVGALYVVAGWLILQVADVLFEALALPGWALRLVLALLILGFPLVVIFSWVYEMTPEGLRREQDVDRSETITPATGRRIDRLIIAGLVVVVTVLVAERFFFMPEDAMPGETAPDALAVPSEAAEGERVGESLADVAPTEAESRKSIAVLPFVNMSGDEENEYFSDGLTEELLNLLARIEGLRVSSRTSSFAFKGKDVSIPNVGDELKVGHVLEGSVRKSGTRLRITAQLIDVETDSHLWSDTYDRELDDIFAIQDEIASAVVDALKVQLLAGGGATVSVPRETTTDVYLLYLRARHTYELGKDTSDPDLVQRAMAMYEAALAANPEFALAYAGLADVYGRLAIESELELAEGYEKSREMALKALDFDPNLVEALLALADVQLEYDWDMRAAEVSYRKALALRPSDAEGLRSYAYFLVTDGRTDEAVDYYHRAIEVDPLQVRAYSGLTFALLTGERFDQYREWMASDVSIPLPEELLERFRAGMNRYLARMEGRWEDVVASMEGEAPRMLADLSDLIISHHRLGNAQQAVEYLDQLEALVQSRDNFFAELAAVYAQIGQPDLAMEYLEKSVEMREVNNAFIRVDPDLRPLHDDPRYLDLLERAGLEPPPG